MLELIDVVEVGRGDHLEHRDEPREEVVVAHPRRQLREQPVFRSPVTTPLRRHDRAAWKRRGRAHRTTTCGRADRNRQSGASGITFRPGPCRCPVRRSQSNRSTSSTRSTPSTSSSTRTTALTRRSTSNGQPHPSMPPDDRIEEPVDGLGRPLTYQCSRSPRPSDDECGDGDPAEDGRSDLDGGAEDAALVHRRAQPGDLVVRQCERVEVAVPGLAVRVRDDEQADRSAALDRWEAAHPCDRWFGFGGEALVVLAGHGLLTGSEGEGSAAQEVVDRLAVHPTERRHQVRHAHDSGDSRFAARRRCRRRRCRSHRHRCDIRSRTPLPRPAGPPRDAGWCRPGSGSSARSGSHRWRRPTRRGCRPNPRR